MNKFMILAAFAAVVSFSSCNDKKNTKSEKINIEDVSTVKGTTIVNEIDSLKTDSLGSIPVEAKKDSLK